MPVTAQRQGVLLTDRVKSSADYCKLPSLPPLSGVLMLELRVIAFFLAVIACTLLFGGDTVLGYLKAGGIALAVVFVLALVVSAAIGFVRMMAGEFQRKNTPAGQVFTVACSILFLLGAALYGHIGYLWVSGASDPIAVNQPLDGILLAGIFATIAVTAAILICLSWGGILATFKAAPMGIIRWARRAFVAPVVLPMRRWQAKSAQGAGVPLKVASCALATLEGLTLFALLSYAVIFAGFLIALPWL